MKILNGKSGKNKNRNLLYGNIFLIGSLLHAGNTVDYFKSKAKKLVVFYFLGSLREEKDFIQLYRNGDLVLERKLFAPKIPFVYHAFIYFWYVQSLIKYFPAKEKIYIITFHPLFFLLNTCIRLFRKIEIVFWIADVIPNPK